MATLLSWALLLPPYAGPREAAQVDLVLRAAEDPIARAPVVRPLTSDVAAAVAGYDFFGDERLRLLPGAVAPRVERRSFTALDAETDGGPARILAEVPTAQVRSRPPAHALLGAAWLSLTPGSQSWAHDRQVLHLRLLNVLLLAPLPLLLHAAACRLRARPEEALSAAALALGLPMLSHLGGSVAAEALLVLTAGICAAAGARALRGGLSQPVGALLGAGACVAMLTAGTGGVVAAWVVVVVLLGLRRAEGARPARLGAVLSLGGVAVGAAWWLLWGRDVPFLVGRPPTAPSWLAAADGVVGNLPTPMIALLGQSFDPVIGHLITSTFGAFGFARVPFNVPAAVVSSLVVAGGVVVAVAASRGRARNERAVLALPVLALVALVGWLAVTADAPYRVAEGRHLLPGIVMALPVAAIGFGTLAASRGRPWLPLITLVCVVAAQVHALAVAVGATWAPGDVAFGWVAAWRAWMPVTAGVAVLPLLLAVGAMAVLGQAFVLTPSRLVRAAGDGLPPRWRVVAAANAAALAVIVAILLVAQRAGIDGDALVRDTIAVGGGQLYAGLLSNLGVVVWVGGAGACLLAGTVLRERPGPDRHAGLLLGAGVLTAILATDDLILFHEGGGLGPQLLGIPEPVILGSYGLALVGLGFAYRDLLPTLPGRGVLVLAMVCFAASQGIDLVDERLFHVVTEDVVKLIGIVNWTVGWGLAAAGGLRAAGAPQTPSASSKPMPHRRSRSLEE